MEVNHPDEINTLFDSAIVYAKGSRLMHMLRRWLGDEAFAKGLKAYFENISTTTLLDEISGMPPLMLQVKMSLVSWILGWSNQVTLLLVQK